jgi:hypothetical protein
MKGYKNFKFFFKLKKFLNLILILEFKLNCLKNICLFFKIFFIILATKLLLFNLF